MSDLERNWLRNWLLSVSTVLILQIGALIWFLSAQAAETHRLGRTIDKIEPQHHEIYYFYTHHMRHLNKHQ